MTATLRGAVCWALVPFTAESPFRPYAGRDAAPFQATAEELLQAAAEQRGDVEHVLLLPAKIRPVLCLHDPFDPRRPELAALRIARLGRLAAEERERMAAGAEPDYIPLAPPARYGLDEDCAVEIGALLRLHRSSIAGRPVGYLTTNELRTVGERLAARVGLDLTGLVVDEALRRLRELSRRSR